MSVALRGLIYGSVVFALGFLAGAVRTIWLAPAIGEVPAVLAEMPVMLLAAWAVSGWLETRGPALTVPRALAMGGVALGALWSLELAMVVLLFGVPFADAPAAFLTPAGRIGVAGQFVFGLFPAIRAWRG